MKNEKKWREYITASTDIFLDGSQYHCSKMGGLLFQKPPAQYVKIKVLLKKKIFILTWLLILLVVGEMTVSHRCLLGLLGTQNTPLCWSRVHSFARSYPRCQWWAMRVTSTTPPISVASWGQGKGSCTQDIFKGAVWGVWLFLTASKHHVSLCVHEHKLSEAFGGTSA